MRLRHNSVGSRLLLVASLAALPATVSSQGVYVTAPNNKILEVDFDTGEAQPVVVDKGKNFQGLVVRKEGQQLRLIVANTTQGGDVRIYDPASGAGARVASFTGAHGVALDPSGDIYAVNRTGPKGQVIVVPRDLGCPNAISGGDYAACFPGGYGPKRLIDRDVKVNRRRVRPLADVRFVRGGPAAGTLMVLAESPPMILRYDDLDSCDGNCEPQVVAPSAEFGGFRPRGLELAPNGEFLVTTEQAVVLRFSAGGERIATSDFADLTGAGAKLSLGFKGSENILFATVPGAGEHHHNGSRLERFRILADGTGESTGLVEGLNGPEGVGNVRGTASITPTGSNVTVLLPTITTIFDEVLEGQAGVTDATCQLYEAPSDPEYDCDAPRQVLLSELSSELPNVLIPDYVKPFRVGDPDEGQCAFFLCELATTAGFAETILQEEHEQEFLGYDPPCETFGTDPTAEARFFWARDPRESEPTVAEGDIFVDISTDCGSNVGRGWGFSFALPAVIDTRDVCDIADFKIDNLHTTVADFTDPLGLIDGACDLGTGAPLPKEPANAVFVAAGLGDKSGWTPVSGGAQDTWGSGGNGLLLGGGTIVFELRSASWHHQFGTSETGAARPLSPIIANSSSPGSGTYLFTPSVEPYTFYFKNLNGSLKNATVFSDGVHKYDPGNRLDIAIFRDNDDPGRYALFFDDGGGDDDDFNDLVLTATGEIGTACRLETILERAESALDQCEDPDFATVVDELQSFVGEIQGNPDDFDNSTRNVTGELRARAQSGTFIACKEIDEERPAVCLEEPEL